jgi:hypothetical protein
MLFCDPPRKRAVNSRLLQADIGLFLTLHRVVLLFDMRATTSNRIYAIIRSSREAILPIQRLKTITTNRLSQVEDPRYVELLVSFYSPPEKDADNF